MSSALLMAATVAGVVVPNGDPCLIAAEDEIVVCKRAPDADRFRLPLRRDPPADATPLLPRAEWGLGGGVRMGIDAASAALPQGTTSNRAMVQIKVPF